MRNAESIIYSPEQKPRLLKALEPYFGDPQESLHTQIKRKRCLSRFSKERIPGQDTTALVIGRFQPPHPGHFYLLEAALHVADHVIVGIGSANKRDTDKNPFSAELRKFMLHEGLRRRRIQSHYRFVYLNDYDEDLDDYDKDQRWCDETLKLAGKPDVVVGNNDWVNNIFRANNVRALEIKELERSSYQGTVIRESLLEQGILPLTIGGLK